LPDRDPCGGFAAERIVVEEREAEKRDECGKLKGSRKRRRRAGVCPSGVLRSSVVSAMDLPESFDRTIP
jgi:hypothetical protein